MKHGRTIITHILLVLMIGSGCNNANSNNESKELNITKVTSEERQNLSITNQVKQLLMKQKEVSNVKAVNSDKELLIAVEINQMDRFRLKEIEKRLIKITEDNYPNHKVTLTIDQKIFLELEKLEKQITDTNMSKKKLEKEIKRIKSLSEEIT